MDLFGDIAPPATTEDTATPPPLQELPMFEHPRTMPFCIGHDALETQLLELYKSGRMPHGLVFSGIKGIGKATLAYRLSRFLLKHGLTTETPPETLDVGQDDASFRRVASGGDPDFLTIECAYDEAKNRYKDSVDVAEIRRVEPFLRRTASGGGWRVVIIDDADTMKRSAQNALLKILEEPPKNTVIILIAHRIGALISTIRSRTRTLHFNPLKAQDIQTLLLKKGVGAPPEEMDILIGLCEGSFGRALDTIDSAGLETLAKILEALEGHPNWNWPHLHRLADDLARAGADKAYESFETLLPWMMAQLCRTKARGGETGNPILHKPVFETLLRQSSLEHLLKTCENLSAHFGKIRYANLDKRQGVLGAFSIIAA